MKAFELYVLDLFLNIQKQFPSSCHNQVLAQIRQVYAPIQWPLMVPEDQQHYYDLEIKTSHAANRNMVVIPIQSDHEKMKMYELVCDESMVSEAREKLYPVDPVKKEELPSLDTKALSEFQEIKILDGVNELQDEEQAEVLEEFNIEVVDVESADGVENSILHLTSLN